MLADVENRDQAGPALGHVHPVAGPGVVNDVGLSAQPDPDAVEVREQVLQQKRADGDNAEQRVQLAQQERVSLAGAQGLYTAADCVRARLLNCGHEGGGS